jgi:parallel beta-helix repeat protein
VIYPYFISNFVSDFVFKVSEKERVPAPWLVKKYKSSGLIETNFLKSFFRGSVLLFSFSIGVASTTLLHASLELAIAETPNRLGKQQAQVDRGEKTISQVNVLFVNPSVGDDKVGNGSEQTPWKTITRAIEVAAPNSTIILAQGTYSSATGEVFPLILKPGITIQGDVRSKGRGTVIQGGDDYLSRSFGKQNVGIVAANNTTVTGITVTNPNPRGYGMLIESANAVISENIFVGSTQDGISVTGNAAPTISKNYFYQNKANGLTVSGNARGEIRENIFQQTGFGINIAQNAEPLIIGNQIQYNRAGIVVQANARPKLRNNQILSNREDGLVVIAQAMPDLGNANEAGGNEFRNNTRYDINANASKQLFSAFGNRIASDRIAGKIDLSGNGNTVNTGNRDAIAQSLPVRRQNQLQNQLQPQQTTPTITSGNEITFAAPNAPAETNSNLSRTNTLRNNRSISKSGLIVNPAMNGLNSQLMPLQAANSMLNTALNTAASAPKLPTARTPERNINQQNGFPTPSSLPAYPQPRTNQREISDTAQINYVRINPGTIEFSAPQTGVNQAASGTIQPIQTIPAAPMPYNSPSLVASVGNPMVNTATGIRYRVIVPTTSDRDEEIVRFLAPGAFRTNRQGQAVIQVGVFSNTFNAEQMLRVLNNNGLKGAIEPLN